MGRQASARHLHVWAWARLAARRRGTLVKISRWVPLLVVVESGTRAEEMPMIIPACDFGRLSLECG